LPDFSWYNIPKRENIPINHNMYQMATKYTKWPQNIPNGHKIYQNATKYTKWPQNIPNGHNILPNGNLIHQRLPLQVPPKFTQIWFENMPSGNPGRERRV
jgi:hypothetical protein